MSGTAGVCAYDRWWVVEVALYDCVVVADCGGDGTGGAVD